jgi:predicted phosphate transport protein (TIGR00153 family)
MPKNPLMGIFGRSPIRPLQNHMATVHECVALLTPFFEAVCSGNHAEMDRLQKHISELEDKADNEKHELRLHLPRGLFMPVERRDLLEVLTMQDNIANRVKDIAGLVRGRRMEIPEQVQAIIQEFAARSVDACAAAKKAVDELDELVEIGFRGPEVDYVQGLISELDEIENDTDEIQVRVRATIMGIERDLHPIDAIFLYRIVDWIGDVADRSQRVGSRLQLMLAH